MKKPAPRLLQKLAVKRETLRSLAQLELAQAVGGFDTGSVNCPAKAPFDTGDVNCPAQALPLVHPGGAGGMPGR